LKYIVQVINDYFDSLVNEVMVHGGDVLKFAGDAFFAEWQVDEDADSMDEDKRAKLNRFQSARALTARRDAVSQKTLAECVSAAAFCGASIVAKHSDFEVSRGDDTSQKSMLNVHCGLGAGNLVGLHVGNIGVDGEDPAGTGQEQRREFLFLGSPIDQVSCNSGLFIVQARRYVY
jgi:class 3 adenylate cyclase